MAPAHDLTDAELLAEASPRPWYFDGWDIFSTGPTDCTGGHRCVVPLPKNTFHPSQRVSDYDAELIVRAVNAFLSVDTPPNVDQPGRPRPVPEASRTSGD